MRIKITPEDLIDVANLTNQTNQTLTDGTHQLKKKIEDLNNRWEGQKCLKFYSDFKHHETQLKRIQAVLKETAKTLLLTAIRFRTKDNKGPTTLAQLKATDEELWRISRLSYIDSLNIANNYNKNLKLAEKQEESIDTIKALKLGENNANWNLFDAVNDTKTGYQAIAMINAKTGEVVISHRGTEFSKYNDIKADVLNVMHGDKQTFQYKSAEDFTKKIQNTVGKDIKLIHTGHSLGGNLAQKMAMDKKNVAVTFNSPGFDPTSFNKELKQDHSKTIRDFVIKGEFVSSTEDSKLKGTTHTLNPKSKLEFLDNHKVGRFDQYFEKSGMQNIKPRK